MPLSMYQLTVPIYTQYLGAVSGVLDKATTYCSVNKINEKVLLQMRVFPDMHPMTRQVGIALYHSGGTVARLAGQEVGNYFGADATSFAELKGRIETAVDLIRGVTPAQLEGSEDRKFELTQAGETFNFSGQVFLQNHALPQFCFHIATAYNILRHAGVKIGKCDFLGELQC